MGTNLISRIIHKFHPVGFTGIFLDGEGIIP